MHFWIASDLPWFQTRNWLATEDETLAILLDVVAVVKQRRSDCSKGDAQNAAALALLLLEEQQAEAKLEDFATSDG